jgi:hypothetical protein
MLTLKNNRLIGRSLGGIVTSFIHKDVDGSFKLYMYTGLHDKEPNGSDTLRAINSYSKAMLLISREEYEKRELVNEYRYEYMDKKSRRQSRLSKTINPRIPLSRTCIRGRNEKEYVHLNFKGFIESGSYVKDGNLVRFKYHYRKNAKFEDELLRAEFVLPHMTCNVSWCAPPARHPAKMERWIPNSRVNEATFVDGSDVYESSWVYDHKFHPTIITTLNGNKVDTPPMIRFDWLDVLKKPTNCNFMVDNPLFQFRSTQTNVIERILGRNRKRSLVSTSRSRSQLWRAWKSGFELDGVIVRWLDEEILRDEDLLKPYWRRRDRGALVSAEDYLTLHADAIMASSDLSNDISSWTSLAIKMGDLLSFGQGGDAVMFTRTKTLQPDTEDTLHVFAVDTGTWPNEGGGVSACRRDMVNNLRTIKWHMVVESANDFGLVSDRVMVVSRVLWQC